MKEKGMMTMKRKRKMMMKPTGNVLYVCSWMVASAGTVAMLCPAMTWKCF